MSLAVNDAMGHSLQVRPRPLVHKCPLCINTDRKFWALGFVAMCQQRSFDHLVGAGKQRRRNFEAERLGGLEIDQQLEPSGLCTPSQSPYSTPAVALLAYQRIAPGWNGSKVLRVKLAGTVSAAAWLACISSSLPEKTASAIA